MRVAIVHDDLVQWGGAERVLLGLTEIYPDAPIFTSVFNRDNKFLSEAFGSKKIITSFLQKIPGWKGIYKALLPLYPLAFEQFNFDNFDLVISHTTRFAKSIVTKPKSKHICYCHTPPRFLWHFSGYDNFGWAEILMTKLRLYDQVVANRVDFFLAGSKNAKKRIKKVYGVDAKVVYPFIDLNRFENVETFEGGYFVTIGRPNQYKRFDLAKAACQQLGFELKIIAGDLDDKMVAKVLAGCRALIIPGEEDFGLVALEAQALGKPVIAFSAGGNLETVIDSKTGIYFDKQDVDSLKKAMEELKRMSINPAICIDQARKFSKEKFKSDFVQAVASLEYTI